MTQGNNPHWLALKDRFHLIQCFMYILYLNGIWDKMGQKYFRHSPLYSLIVSGPLYFR